MGFFSFLYPRRYNVTLTNYNDDLLDTGYYFIEKITNAILNKKSRVRRNNILYVIEFNGDTMASGADALSKEVTAILSVARIDKKLENDEVLIKINSPGGAAYAYGYASSQIKRLMDGGLKVTVAVDKVAASGGYMMAAVSNKIIASPFSIIGSIGVVSEFPNFYNLLSSLGVEYKQYTAGKFKRTVSQMGKITDDAEQKFKDDLFQMYDLFKAHISKYRPKVDIEKVATGEHWYGERALEIGLVDELKTSEEYIFDKMWTHEVIVVKYNDPYKPWYAKGVSTVAEIFINAIESKIKSNISGF